MITFAPLRRLRDLIVGAARDPLKTETNKHLALVAFLAWVGLGADGLSSANYGPEEAFLALGGHTHLALYLAVMTAATVFIIGFSYNQVIELFPSGGGGYRVATTLIGPYAGLISGAALIVDYVLTISISIASAADALFSLLPYDYQPYKLIAELVLTLFLMVLNLRGMKEPLNVLVPLFLGFVVTHAALIIYGVAAHGSRLPELIPLAAGETHAMIQDIGWVGFASLLLRAFAMGGGTYTGIEAVSDNAGILREPRVRTGRWTMLYMAISLSFVAGGLIVVYLLWDVTPVPGQTLNAVTFNNILGEIFGTGSVWQSGVLVVVLGFAATLLFVAANTGFLGGPAVLAFMAADRWVPHQFNQLSNRLVTQNGVMLMGLAAIAVLALTAGAVNLLVVLYSINVFLTFSLSLYGLCVYWGRHFREPKALRHLLLAGTGLLVSAGILCVTIFEKFLSGAWLTVLITGLVIALCLAIRRHYVETARKLAEADQLFAAATQRSGSAAATPPVLEPLGQTAVFLVGPATGVAMHTVLSTLKLFPGQFRNCVFVSVGEIDAEHFRGEAALAELGKDVTENLDRFVGWCHRRGIAATSFHAFGTDTVEVLDKLSEKILAQFPNSIFFATKLLFQKDTLLGRFLHNQTALAMQRQLHLRGVPMVIMPMKV